MLLFKTPLPVERFKYRKSLVLPMLNIALGMNPWVRKRLHDAMQEQFMGVFRKMPTFAHGKEDTYRVSIGYFRGRGAETGKKTKTLDIDGLAYIGKVAIDSLIKATVIPDDSIFTIPEVRYKYLGELDQELILFQLERICPETTLETTISTQTTKDTPKPKDGSEVPPKAKMEEIYRDSWKNF